MGVGIMASWVSNVPSKSDKHHIFFPHRYWKRGKAKKLRDHPYCHVAIPRDTLHNQIHLEVPGVPIPNAFAVDAAIFQLDLLMRYGAITLKDPISKRLKILIAVLACMEDPTTEALREQLRIVHEFENAHH